MFLCHFSRQMIVPVCWSANMRLALTRSVADASTDNPHLCQVKANVRPFPTQALFAHWHGRGYPCPTERFTTATRSGRRDAEHVGAMPEMAGTPRSSWRAEGRATTRRASSGSSVDQVICNENCCRAPRPRHAYGHNNGEKNGHQQPPDSARDKSSSNLWETEFESTRRDPA